MIVTQSNRKLIGGAILLIASVTHVHQVAEASHSYWGSDDYHDGNDDPLERDVQAKLQEFEHLFQYSGVELNQLGEDDSPLGALARDAQQTGVSPDGPFPALVRQALEAGKRQDPNYEMQPTIMLERVLRHELPVEEAIDRYREMNHMPPRSGPMALEPRVIEAGFQDLWPNHPRDPGYMGRIYQAFEDLCRLLPRGTLNQQNMVLELLIPTLQARNITTLDALERFFDTGILHTIVDRLRAGGGGTDIDQLLNNVVFARGEQQRPPAHLPPFAPVVDAPRPPAPVGDERSPFAEEIAHLRSENARLEDKLRQRDAEIQVLLQNQRAQAAALNAKQGQLDQIRGILDRREPKK
jgi:hypothetical protein